MGIVVSSSVGNSSVDLEDMARRLWDYGPPVGRVAFESSVAHGRHHIALLNYSRSAQVFVETFYPIPCASPHHEEALGFQLEPAEVFDSLDRMSPHFQRKILTFMAEDRAFEPSLRARARELVTGRAG